MVGLGILVVSLFIALMFAAYKYEQLEADNELYDSLLEDCHAREVEMESMYDTLKYEFDNYKRISINKISSAQNDSYEARIIDLQETIDKAMEGGMRLVIENMELNDTIDMLAEAEVARNFPEEVNE